MRVLIDVSVFGSAAHSPRARTGIFRATEDLALALADAGPCQVRLCASRQHEEAVAYWRSHPRLRERLPFPTVGGRSRLGRAVRAVKRRLGQFYYAHQDHPWVRWPMKYGSLLPLYLEERVRRWTHRRLWRDNLAFAQVYHALHFERPAEVLRAPDLRRFTTLNDVIPLRFPHFFSGLEPARMRALVGQFTPDDWVLCPSECTRRDLAEYGGVDPARIRVAALAADPAKFYPVADERELARTRREYGLDERPYILSLCTLEPRKNLRNLLRAYVRMSQETGLDAQLVMVGPKGWNLGPLMDELARAGPLRDRIVLTGFVRDEDLAPLYSGAAVFAYPSIYEGFGLPVLEAMQCGAPVITSSTSSLPEVAGDAARLVDPTDADALAQALVDVLDDPALQRDLRARSLARAGHFSWRRCAGETVAAYRQALAAA